MPESPAAGSTTEDQVENQHVLSTDPLCTGPDLLALVSSAITPESHHFIRNHVSAPQLSETDHVVRIDGMVERPDALAVPDLRELPRRTVIATIQCAGNRRAELHGIRPFKNELLWGGEAIGTARWAGPLLRDVLATVGIQRGATHVWFEGADRIAVPKGHNAFGSGLRLDRALMDDVVIAYDMNDQPLTVMHGAPLRVVIPGAIGARSVKWLARITVADHPSSNPFEVDGYHFRAPDDAGNGYPLTDMPLNSFICTPVDGSGIPEGQVRIVGYATGRGLIPITRVEVAVDNEAWQRTTLLDPPAPGVWVRWTFDTDLVAGAHSIAVRAFDAQGHTQPSDVADRWNVGGYANDAWHTVRVFAERKL